MIIYANTGRIWAAQIQRAEQKKKKPKTMNQVLSLFTPPWGSKKNTAFRHSTTGREKGTQISISPVVIINFIPSPVSPRPAEAKISRLGHARPAGHDAGDRLVAMETPLLSSPRRHFLASYIFKAFRSTLFTITDYENT